MATKKKKLKMRAEPQAPVRQTEVENFALSCGTTLQELVEWASQWGTPLDQVTCDEYGCWDSCETFFTLTRQETDAEFDARVKEYKKKLKEYKQWRKENKEAIEQIEREKAEKEKERAAKKRERAEKELARLEKEVERKRKELEKN